MSEYPLRKAAKSDAPAIAALNEQFRLDIPGFRWGTLPWVEGEIDKGHYYVIRDEAGVAGAVCLHTHTEKLCRPFPEGRTGVIDAIAVRPDLKGKGLGRHLIAGAEEEFVSRGIATSVVESFSAYGLEGFYQACGFTRDPQPARFEGHEYFLYHKDIAKWQGRTRDGDSGASRKTVP